MRSCNQLAIAVDQVLVMNFFRINFVPDFPIAQMEHKTFNKQHCELLVKNIVLSKTYALATWKKVNTCRQVLSDFVFTLHLFITRTTFKGFTALN